MKKEIFIGWSGYKSKYVAEALKDWIPNVIQNADPWISGDTDKGDQWFKTIFEKLGKYNFGIFCITKENLGSVWMNFEAGALAKAIDTGSSNRIIPYLIGDVDISDLSKGPLEHFQACKANSRDDTFKLMESINNALEEESLSEKLLVASFGCWWRDLEKKLENLPKPIGILSDITERLLTEELKLEKLKISPEEWKKYIEKENACKIKVELINIDTNFYDYVAILNPYGSTYPENDIDNFTTLDKILQYVRNGGLFINVADLPGFAVSNPKCKKEYKRTTETDNVTDIPLVKKLGLQIVDEKREWIAEIGKIKANFAVIINEEIVPIILGEKAKIDDIGSIINEEELLEVTPLFLVKKIDYSGKFLISLSYQEYTPKLKGLIIKTILEIIEKEIVKNCV